VVPVEGMGMSTGEVAGQMLKLVCDGFVSGVESMKISILFIREYRV